MNFDFKKLNPFRDKSRDGIDPAYVSYYQTTDDNQRLTAALLGFITLLAAMLLILGIFIGGRWIVNRLTGKEEVATTQTTTETSETSTSGQTGTLSTNTDKQPVPVAAAPGNSGSSVASETTTAPAPQATGLPRTGIESLPRTGVE